MTTHQKKYKVGTVLRKLKTREYTDYDNELDMLPIGGTAVIGQSVRYKDAYCFVGHEECGWDVKFIEDPEHFALASIKSWKKELEGD